MRCLCCWRPGESEEGTKSGWKLDYLHDAVPVVTSGNLEEREESHPEVLEGGVPAHSLAGVVSVTH